MQAQSGRNSTSDKPGWNGQLLQRWEFAGAMGQVYHLDRIAVVYSSRDSPQPGRAAERHLTQMLFASGAGLTSPTAGIPSARSSGGEWARSTPRRYDTDSSQIVAEHQQAWSRYWAGADIVLLGDEKAAKALRFAIYHLGSAANPHDDRVSIGARALTGEAYKGHVLWDTEAFILPFFVLTQPSAARALLQYRYHTLPAARAKAGSLGYRGALYAWESTDTGEEATPSFSLTLDGKLIPILSGNQEHHISANVAYAVWHYWQITGDDGFFRESGAEIMLDTARFWASRGSLEEDGYYHIRCVIGPDEYHESVDDNAYTNGMAQWNLEYGAQTGQLMAERWPERWKELTRQIAITSDELAQWRSLAKAMYLGMDPATGLIEQFRGFYELAEFDLSRLEPLTTPPDVLLGRSRVKGAKIIKQADVLMLLFQQWERFPRVVHEANFNYYHPRTAHGSSLSPAIHAAFAARLGQLALAERYLSQAASIDLQDTMGNAAGGVHIGAMGGLWQAIVWGFGGLQLQPDGLAFDPQLPASWQQLKFRLQWRGCQLAVILSADPNYLTVQLAGEDAMNVGLTNGTTIRLLPGQQAKARQVAGCWSDWEVRLA
ncbi:MAG: glycoside hydrolase family 65 protein [Cyanobacteria bacterium NC_groundwater_1444_Ag_S-0.65um_54_12]|nr:glycoside hydrolase family 65 protein [Cyanobacteria bacterium NC_groundwater_1444_Ag_S-0.65um_54_12]